MDFSLLGLWAQMGTIARGVVFILLAMSVLGIAIAVERWVTYRRGRARSLGYLAALEPLLEDDQEMERAARLHLEWQEAPLAKVVAAGLAEYQRARDKRGGPAADPIERELVAHAAGRAMERAKKREIGGLNRGLAALATISSSAPFVGLFGTVFGIITAFQQMADPSGGGGGGLATVSAGIAEALLTTAVGLAVAIVAVWCYNFFVTKLDQLSLIIDDAAGEVVERLARRQGT